MKIKVTETVLDYPVNGTPKPIPSSDGDLTFRAVFNNALNAIVPNETIPAEKKSKLFQITLKLYSSNEPELTVDEASLIKERVGLVYNALVYGRVCELLDK